MTLCEVAERKSRDLAAMRTRELYISIIGNMRSAMDDVELRHSRASRGGERESLTGFGCQLEMDSAVDRKPMKQC
jgi:hypothetical protein